MWNHCFLSVWKQVTIQTWVACYHLLVPIN
jgi:hypothetical protein